MADTQADAAALVAMTVADLAAMLDTVDLPTLKAALDLERAREGGARRGATNALNAEIALQEGKADTMASKPTPENKIGTDDLHDKPRDPEALSNAPPRPSEALIHELELRWHDLCNFARRLEGNVDGDLGEVLAFVRSKI